jgi:ArsR family transcriptional regulator
MEKLTLLFKALSDETRLRILNLLLKTKELCVCDIESTLKCTQTKISRHMSYLTRAGLTQDRKAGRWVLYSIAKPKTEEQRIIIQNIREILVSHAQAKKDLSLLRKNIDNGCCATFTECKSTLERKEAI